jgi:NAD dependent epimerase/dehydratase
MKVLVTGANGFIGSHVAETLVLDGYEVRAFCEYNSFGSYGWLDDLDPAIGSHVELVLGDIRDQGSVERATEGCNAVLHLAALIAIPYSYQAPRSYIDTNVHGTLNVLEAARRFSLERVIVTSTSEVYGTPDHVPITESHALKGQSPYAASKIAADKLAEAWAASFELPVMTLRPFNTFGPRQSLRAIIPTVVGQLLAGPVVRVGSVHPQRDFTYVGDTAEGFRLALTADVKPGSVVQLGTGRAVSVGQIIDSVGELLGVQPDVHVEEERVRPKHSEVQVLLSDPSSAATRLGWVPQVSLEHGLENTIEWMKARQFYAHTASQRYVI